MPRLVLPAESPPRPGTDSDGRAKLRAIHRLLADHPDLAPAYTRAREIIRRYRTSGYYEITARCNLKCEGCYYFESEGGIPEGEETDLARWDEFFRSEQARGVSMGYFVGAEPAIEQERLLVASRYIPYGTIGTNGTAQISREVPYNIHVSVWGDEATDADLRGGHVFRKALRIYRDDPRVVALLTLNHRNIGHVRDIAERCRDHGIRLTLNLYSPTTTYLRKLRERAPNDETFFRLSSPDDNLLLTQPDLERIRDVAAGLLDEFPGTFLYSHAYNRFVTSPSFGYDIDPETGIARDCHSRIRGHLRYYTPDLRLSPRKCCTSEVDCRECRLYSGGWSGRLEPTASDLETATAFADWLDMVAVIGRIFVNEMPGRHYQATPADSRSR